VVGKSPASQDAVRKISNGGRRIDLASLLVSGKVTVVDFYADWCGPCRRISPHLERLVRSDADVYLRKVDIVKWGTPVTKQFGIRSVPNIRVFDRNGRMVGSGTSNLNLVQQYVRQAKQ
jgi:thioredoxin 1